MNDDPRRLIDDPDVSEAIRAHLAAARAETAVPIDLPAAVARHMATVATGGVGTGVTAAMVLKLAGVVAIGGGIAAMVASSAKVPAADVQRDPMAMVPSEIVLPSALEQPPAAKPESIADAAPQPGTNALNRRTPPTGPGPRLQPTWAGKREQATADPGLVQHEAHQTARARAMLEHDPVRTLDLLTELQRDLGEGFFGEEREALQVLALAAIGRTDDARRRGRAFLRRHPNGAFSAKVRQALAALDDLKDPAPAETGPRGRRDRK
jgi:hypothetical protein